MELHQADFINRQIDHVTLHLQSAMLPYINSSCHNPHQQQLRQPTLTLPSVCRSSCRPCMHPLHTNATHTTITVSKTSTAKQDMKTKTAAPVSTEQSTPPAHHSHNRIQNRQLLAKHLHEEHWPTEATQNPPGNQLSLTKQPRTSSNVHPRQLQLFHDEGRKLLP
jgi:hypothetical protein